MLIGGHKRLDVRDVFDAKVQSNDAFVWGEVSPKEVLIGVLARESQISPAVLEGYLGFLCDGHANLEWESSNPIP